MLTTSIIIPTYNREEQLLNCIQSILKQTLLPKELIIIDDGDLKTLPLKKECADRNIHYVYHKKTEPGLTKSRNTGITLAHGDIIFFFDDDVVLLPAYIEEILNVYNEKNNSHIGGIGGIMINHPPLPLAYRMRRILDIIFLNTSFSEGKVLPSGFCTDFGKTSHPIEKITPVDFLLGCAMSFRKNIFTEFSFIEKYHGYALGEDKDFCYQVSKKHTLLVHPLAKLYHYEADSMRPDKFKIGRMFVIDRYLFFKSYVKKRPFDWLFFYYALLGYLLIRTLIFIFSPGKDKWDRLKGIFSAIKGIIIGNASVQ